MTQVSVQSPKFYTQWLVPTVFTLHNRVARIMRTCQQDLRFKEFPV